MKKRKMNEEGMGNEKDKRSEVKKRREDRREGVRRQRHRQL